MLWKARCLNGAEANDSSRAPQTNPFSLAPCVYATRRCSSSNLSQSSSPNPNLNCLRCPNPSQSSRKASRI